MTFVFVFLFLPYEVTNLDYAMAIRQVLADTMEEIGNVLSPLVS